MRLGVVSRLRALRNGRSLMLAVCLVPFGAQAHIVNLMANLDGANAGTASSATGVAHMVLDTHSHGFDFDMNVQGLGLADLMGVGPNSTAAHIHDAATGGILVDLAFQSAPGFVNNGSGVTLSFYGASVEPAAQGALTVPLTVDELQTALLSGDAYINVHTQAFPAGEISGPLQVVPVPLPATLALMGVGLIALGWSARRR